MFTIIYIWIPLTWYARIISVCFVYTRYEQCILISVANKHYYRKMNLNNLDLLLVHFLRNWLWKHQATLILYFCIHISLYAKRRAINIVICRFNASNASPSICRKQYLGLNICRFNTSFLILKEVQVMGSNFQEDGER